jgi:hypothetical protein
VEPRICLFLLYLSLVHGRHASGRIKYQIDDISLSSPIVEGKKLEESQAFLLSYFLAPASLSP